MEFTIILTRLNQLCTIPLATLLWLGGCASGPDVEGDGSLGSARGVVRATSGTAVADASQGEEVDAGGSQASLSVVPRSTSPVVMDWTYGDVKGRKISTGHFTVYTTGEKPWMQAYAARFLEQALAQYRTAIVELPEPPSTLETYLFARRSEWQDFTRGLMKDHAELYLNLGRGGYSTRGIAVLYDIHFNDTFAIMSHEGWHQYTQVTFQNPLPTWLEEGLATYMEGRRQAPNRPVEFEPWSNHQRYEALHRAWASKELIGLAELVDRSPQHFLKEGTDGLLTYYAQVWALVHFMLHGEDGKYRQALSNVLRDAAAGRMAARIMTSSNITSPNNRRLFARSQYGPGVLLAYFDPNWAGDFQKEFNRFIERMLRDPNYLRGLYVDPAGEANGGEGRSSQEQQEQEATSTSGMGDVDHG